MASKTYSNNTKKRSCAFRVLIAGLFLLSSCSVIRPVPEKSPDSGLPEPEIVDTADHPGQSPDSRMLASHSLTLEGYRLLKKNDYNGAIRILERAVGINPADGPGYFYLAEAWLEKKNFNLAAQFNGLATLYLRNDTTWSSRAKAQKKRIDRGINGM